MAAVNALVDELREECGVFGVFGHPDAVRLTYFGLYALQHRGQESAGIVAQAANSEFIVHRDSGLVSTVFGADVLGKLADAGATAALGHVRDAEGDGSDPTTDLQPLVVRCRGVQLALAYNGNFVDAEQLRSRLEAQGAVFHSTVGVEVIAQLAARRGGDWPTALAAALAQIKGGYAMAALTPDGLFAARDPHGIRPLVLGHRGDAFIVASESCAFDAVGGTLLRAVEPGEWVWVDAGGLRSGRLPAAADEAFCIFEFVYFARPDSVFHGRSVHEVRKQLGRRLAMEAPVAADVVIGVPDSSLPAALGYGEQAGIPVELGLIKNRYVGRTFIRPAPTREEAVRIKLNPVRAVAAGRRVVLVDDSLVRGTTSRHLIQIMRHVGATEVHLRITSPPYRFPCHCGVSANSRGQLIASGRNIDEIRQMIGADSLHFLSVDAMLAATGLAPSSFCIGCFSGEYPVPPVLDQAVGQTATTGVRSE